MAILQSPMPGQAVMPQMTAPKSAATPAAEVGQYEGMSLEELVAAYMRKPSGVLLGLIDKADKARKLNEAQQGQQALAQMQQQQGTVADEKLAQVLQGAGGMRRMATGGIVALSGGGIVALQSGGDPEIQRILRKAPATRTQEENARLEAAGISLERRTPAPYASWINRLDRFLAGPFLRETFTGGANRLSDDELRKRNDAGALTETIARALGSEQTAPAAAAAAQPAAVIPSPRPVSRNEAAELPAAGPTPSPRPRNVESTEKPPAAAPAAAPAANPIAQAFHALLATQPPQGVAPELQAQREKVTGLQALQEQQALEDAKRIREEVVRTGQRRMDRANVPFIEDARALAALAGDIDPRRGRTFGSLGTGIASALSERETRKQKAEEYIAAGSDKVRQLNATYRQLQLENAKYQEALLSGDAKTARESAEKMAALRYKYETDKEELEIKRSEARAKTIAAGAQAAAVPSRIDAASQAATARLAAVLNSDPILQGYRKRLEGALISPDDEAALLTKMRTRERELLLQYAPELAALRQTAGAGTTGASTARAEADKIIQGQQ